MVYVARVVYYLYSYRSTATRLTSPTPINSIRARKARRRADAANKLLLYYYFVHVIYVVTLF